MTKTTRILGGRSFALAMLLAVAASCHSVAYAGVPMPNIPRNGQAAYGQLPDGSFAPLQLDNSQQLKASGGGSGSSVYQFTQLGCGQLTSLSAAAGFSSVPAGALLVSISVEGQSVRLRDDGTNPTASVGLLLPVGGPWPYQANLAGVKFIQTAASATISYCFYK